MERIVIHADGSNLYHVQRDIWNQLYTEINKTKNTIVTTNVAIGSMLKDLSEFESANITIGIPGSNPNISYLIGEINGIQIQIDPTMGWDDTKVIGNDLEILINVDPLDFI